MRTFFVIITGLLLIALLACESENRIEELIPEVVDTMIVVEEVVSEVINENNMDYTGDPGYPLDSLMAFNSEQDLIAAYGKENIKREHRWGAEGEYEYYVSVLFPGQINQVELAWRDSINFSGLASIYISGWNGTPGWVTEDGIGIGTRMNELEKLNAKPITFYGFDWDYSGLVSWSDGNLANKGLVISLNVSDDYEFEDASEMIGDKEFSSDDAIAQKVNPMVVSITLVKQ